MTNPRVLPAPRPARTAAWISVAQCVVGIAYAVLLLIRQFVGVEEHSIVNEGANNMSWVGLGTAVFMIIVFGAVIAGAASILRSTHKWGRGPIVVLEILFLPIAWQMGQGGAWPLAVVTGLSALAALALMFQRESVEWAAANYGA